MPSEVQRITFLTKDDKAIEVVAAADYDRLRAERDALAASHGRLVEELERTSTVLANRVACGLDKADDEGSMAGLRKDIAEALRLARDLPADGVMYLLNRFIVASRAGDEAGKSAAMDALRTALEPRP